MAAAARERFRYTRAKGNVRATNRGVYVHVQFHLFVGGQTDYAKLKKIIYEDDGLVSDSLVVSCWKQRMGSKADNKVI